MAFNAAAVEYVTTADAGNPNPHRIAQKRQLLGYVPYSIGCCKSSSIHGNPCHVGERSVPQEDEGVSAGRVAKAKSIDER